MIDQKVVKEDKQGGRLSRGRYVDRFGKQAMLRQTTVRKLNTKPEYVIKKYRTLHTIAHANLQPYYCVLEEQQGDEVSFISELCYGVSLQNYLAYIRKNPQPWQISVHRMLYLAMRVLYAVAQAVRYLHSQQIEDFSLSLDSVMLYLLGDVKLADYCLKRTKFSRESPVFDFMLQIYEECLSPLNFEETFHKTVIQTGEFFRLKVLREIHSMLSQRELSVEDYLLQFMEYYGLYCKKITDVYETAVMVRFMEEVDAIYRSRADGGSHIKKSTIKFAGESLISEYLPELKSGSIQKPKPQPSLIPQPLPVAQQAAQTPQISKVAGVSSVHKSTIPTMGGPKPVGGVAFPTTLPTIPASGNSFITKDTTPITSVVECEQPLHKSSVIAQSALQQVETGSYFAPKSRPVQADFQKKPMLSCLQMGVHTNSDIAASGSIGSVVAREPAAGLIHRSQPIGQTLQPVVAQKSMLPQQSTPGWNPQKPQH